MYLLILVADEYLDTEIVILLQGENALGNPVYSYTEILGSDLKLMFAEMQAGENFQPSDYGTVLYSGAGSPPQDIRDKMDKEYNMSGVPLPFQEPAMLQTFLNDETV